MELNAEVIKESMMEKCLTVRQLAKIAGVSETAIYRSMYHGGKPNTSTIGKLSKALGVPAKELIAE